MGSESLETLSALAKASMTNCPKCPACHATCGLPNRPEFADWNHRARRTDTLVCLACGYGWEGAPGPLKAATDAQFAWALHEAGSYIIAAMGAGTP